MLRSLRSRLIVASLLWTAGLLMIMHVMSVVLIHAVPRMRRIDATVAVLAGLILMAAGLLAARQSLTPFRRLRERLLSLRKGVESRIEGTYPLEVQPLVDDLNALLAHREKAVERAYATAGDLAHGLKTPLALLAREAELAAASGNAGLAEAIAHHVERMSSQVDYHLARARAAASGGAGTARCQAAPCVDALVRTLTKLYAGRAIEIAATVPLAASARVQREDLDEMLGNLLDKACKWARSKVAVDASSANGAIVFTVDDDGPGLPQPHRAVVLKRGVRLDEAAPGSGLGLAIVRDLAELYGGALAIEDSPLGGLRARISLPQE